MLGIIPAAGAGTRIQPLAFSKELLPVGIRVEGGVERPRAVGEYLVERLVAGGADRLCFVISPEKADIMSYFGGSVDGVPVCYVVQQSPAGLCDAIFQALPFADEHETVAVGLPDTVWFPVDGLRALPDDILSFLLFPVRAPQLFDAVVTDQTGRVLDIQVKSPHPTSHLVWGAFKAPVHVMKTLHAAWATPERRDPYIGTLVNHYIARGGTAVAVSAGTSYVDVGTLHGYREALTLLHGDRLAAGAHATTTNPEVHP